MNAALVWLAAGVCCGGALAYIVVKVSGRKNMKNTSADSSVPRDLIEDINRECEGISALLTAAGRGSVDLNRLSGDVQARIASVQAKLAAGSGRVEFYFQKYVELLLRNFRQVLSRIEDLKAALAVFAPENLQAAPAVFEAQPRVIPPTVQPPAPDAVPAPSVPVVPAATQPLAPSQPPPMPFDELEPFVFEPKLPEQARVPKPPAKPATPVPPLPVAPAVPPAPAVLEQPEVFTAETDDHMFPEPETLEATQPLDTRLFRKPTPKPPAAPAPKPALPMDDEIPVFGASTDVVAPAPTPPQTADTKRGVPPQFELSFDDISMPVPEADEAEKFIFGRGQEESLVLEESMSGTDIFDVEPSSDVAQAQAAATAEPPAAQAHRPRAAAPDRPEEDAASMISGDDVVDKMDSFFGISSK